MYAVDSRMKSKGILSNFSLLTYYAEMCDMDKHISHLTNKYDKNTLSGTWS